MSELPDNLRHAGYGHSVPDGVICDACGHPATRYRLITMDRRIEAVCYVCFHHRVDVALAAEEGSR